MPVELVRLTWADHAPAGDAYHGHSILPRARAEALVHWLLGHYGTRFELSIDPWHPLLAEAPLDDSNPITDAVSTAAEAAAVAVAPTPLGKAFAALAFVRGHAGFFAGVGLVLLIGLLAVLAIHLPEPQMRVYPVALLALVSFLVGFLGPKPVLPSL